MSILSLPILKRNAAEISFSLITNTQTFESPLTKTVQTYELPGARWSFKATWNFSDEDDARLMKAWIAKLRGAAGRFYAYDLSHKTVGGNAIGPGVVEGGGQTGRSVISSWSPPAVTADSILWSADDDTVSIDQTYYNSNRWLIPGDYININGELKIVTDIIPLESSIANVHFEPQLRSIPANGSTIIISEPRAIFRLDDDKQDNVIFNPERKPSITISATEAFK